MEATAIKAYEILKKHDFSAEEAEIIIASKDESLSKWVASKEDVAAVREDMAKMEGRLEGNIARLETRLIKWFVGTSIALVSIVFAIMKLAG